MLSISEYIPICEGSSGFSLVGVKNRIEFMMSNWFWSYRVVFFLMRHKCNDAWLHLLVITKVETLVASIVIVTRHIFPLFNNIIQWSSYFTRRMSSYVSLKNGLNHHINCTCSLAAIDFYPADSIFVHVSRRSKSLETSERLAFFQLSQLFFQQAHLSPLIL